MSDTWLNLGRRFAPIPCEKCGASAQLIHRKPESGSEVQTFKCVSCGHLMRRKTEVSDID